MNRLINHIILWALVIVVMAACGGGSDAPTTVSPPTTTPTPTPDPDPTPQPTPEPQQIPIGFRVDLSDVVAGTRSVGDGVLDNEGLQEKGFGVFCWYTGTTNVIFSDSKETTPENHISTYAQNMLMRNQKVEYIRTSVDQGYWTYSPSKYWPLNPEEKLTFRAYAPYTDYIVTDNKGMPQLPVVLGTEISDAIVYGTDYHNGKQHDPLWGTGKLVQKTGENAGEYYPLPDPATDEALKEYYRYGTLYNNITYKMSGDWRDKPTDHVPADTRDGFIDWYFHHGMAMLVFSAKLEENASDREVEIVSISISPLYTQGLLDISSTSTDKDDKPTWDQEDGNMTVTLYGKDDTHTQDLATYTINKDGLTQLMPLTPGGQPKGLLIIPRAYNNSTQLIITVSYKAPATGSQINTVTTKLPNDIQTGFSGFLGNTIYTLNLTVGSALVAEIESVNVATTTDWTEKEGEHEVYNW